MNVRIASRRDAALGSGPRRWQLRVMRSESGVLLNEGWDLQASDEGRGLLMPILPTLVSKILARCVLQEGGGSRDDLLEDGNNNVSLDAACLLYCCSTGRCGQVRARWV